MADRRNGWRPAADGTVAGLWPRFRRLPAPVQAGAWLFAALVALSTLGALVPDPDGSRVTVAGPRTTTTLSTTTTTAAPTTTTAAPTTTTTTTASTATTRSTTTAPVPPAVAAGLPAGDDATVVRVVDGDTIVARVAGRDERVRFIGIDTPETVHPQRPVECFGREAAAHTASLIGPGTAIRLVYDVARTDRYGRTLAYLYRAEDGLFVNLALVRDGYAQVATHPPNVRHVEAFTAAQREAREAGRGLWGACAEEPQGAPVSPPPAAGTATGTCTARMSDPAPVQHSSTTVLFESDLPGRPAAATAHYRTTQTTNSGSTGPDGSGGIEFHISGATAGHAVRVVVEIDGGAARCETAFTPRARG